MTKSLGSEYTEELIGRQVEIVGSDQESIRGMTGVIVDETKNTIKIENDRERTLPKRGNDFKIIINDHEMILKGDKLTYRPEDRIEKLGR